MVSASTLTIGNRRFVVIPEAEYERLRGKRRGTEEPGLPPLPKRLPTGNYPALEYARALTARDIITARRRAGLTQAELARQAGIRIESLNRIERAKTTPSLVTMRKIDRILSKLDSAS